MSQTPDPHAAEPTGTAPEPPAENSFFTSIRRSGMARPADRWVGGVCGAVARKLGVDPLVVRAVLVASVFLAGIGLVLYGVAWALLPEESDGRIHAQELGRGNSDVALLGAAGFVVAGLVAGDGRWTLAGWWNAAGLGWINGLVWLAVVGVVVAIVINGARMSGPAAPTPPGATPPPPAPRPGATPPPPAPHHAAAAAPRETTVSTTIVPAPAGSATPPPPGTPDPRPQWSAPPPRPKAPPVLGAGARFFAVCMGLSLLALAGLLLADRAGIFTGPVLLTALGASAVIFGAGIVVAGLRGRSSGVLGFCAVVALLFSVPVSVATDMPQWSWPSVERMQGIGDGNHVPTTVAEAEGGYAVGMGSLTVDLTELTVPAGETVDIALRTGMGDIDVIVPAEDAARFTLQVGAGEARWDVDGADGRSNGVGLNRTISNTAAEEGDDVVFQISAAVGLGNISIIQED